MRLIHYFFIAILFISFSFVTDNPKTSKKKVESGINPSDTFPVPVKKDILFYIQRTYNTNTIVYELNYNADSTLNEAEPVRIHWIRYASDKKNEDLSYIQRHYAYGLETKLVDDQKKTFKLNFVSYKKRDIYLMRSKVDNKYHAYMTINGKSSFLTNLFVKIEGGTFWVPHITYVEIKGKDVITSAKVVEKFTP